VWRSNGFDPSGGPTSGGPQTGEGRSKPSPRKRAGAHGRSQEAERREFLSAALLCPPRRKLAHLLATMRDVGVDADFQRQDEPAAAANVFD